MHDAIPHNNHLDSYHIKTWIKTKNKPIVFHFFFSLNRFFSAIFFVHVNEWRNNRMGNWPYRVHFSLFPVMCYLVLHTCTYSRTYLFCELSYKTDNCLFKKLNDKNKPKFLPSFRLFSILLLYSNAARESWCLTMRCTVLKAIIVRTWLLFVHDASHMMLIVRTPI